MEVLTKFLRIEMWCLLVVLLIATIYCLLFKWERESEASARVNGRWLYSPINLQLGIITILIAIYLIVQVLQDPTKFPDIHPFLLVVLGLSGMTQVGTKYYSLTRIREKPES
jgi:hypothetical protein